MGSIAPSIISVSLLCVRACSVLCEFAKNSFQTLELVLHTPVSVIGIEILYCVCVCVFVYLMCLMFCVEFNVLFSLNSEETLSRH